MTDKFNRPPSRWLHCPRKSLRLVQNKFLAFKTPLSSHYNNSVPEECRWDVSWVFDYCKTNKYKLGLWIDLTNTTRFYNKEEIEKLGCKYIKVNCKGHGETPSIEQTTFFIKLCQNFIRNNPLEIIGVHCTHGFNRTGFLISSFLIEDQGFQWSVDKAVKEFAQARPPGIYKNDYLEQLFKRYDDPTDWEYFSESVHPTPPRPSWCFEEDEEDAENGSPSNSHSNEPPVKRHKRELNKKNPVFMAGVPGVTPVKDYAKITGIQKKVQQMCGWKSSGFPGCQPVSMDQQNIKLLHNKLYKVSWKADGTRYMMLIESAGEIFFLDRDNSVFQVRGLSFPDPRDLRNKLRDTLLDGEMVIDKVKDKKYPRYLVYDIIMFDGKDVSKQEFFPARHNLIQNHIYGARTAAFNKGFLRRESEPFSVRAKTFYDITQTASLLGDKFAQQLGHEPDGLIFQPATEPYVTGSCDEVLKWKPETHNSVDFKMRIVTDNRPGMLPTKIGQLFVGGKDQPFDQIKITKSLKELDGKIIECNYNFEKRQWEFMRERTDKSFPNSFNTAVAVCKSIRDPVTKNYLLTYIQNQGFQNNDAALMPPPQNR